MQRYQLSRLLREEFGTLRIRIREVEYSQSNETFERLKNSLDMVSHLERIKERQRDQ